MKPDPVTQLATACIAGDSVEVAQATNLTQHSKDGAVSGS